MAQKTQTVTQVNIYRSGSQWCYSAWCDDEHDHNDTIGATTESEARDEVSSLFPSATIHRIEDAL